MFSQLKGCTARYETFRLPMVRRRSTVRFRKGAPSSGQLFENISWAVPFGKRHSSATRLTAHLVSPHACSKRAKGHIQQLPSGSLRVKAYAGTDPVTGKERLLREICPDYPSAIEALGRLLKQVEGHQAPERDAAFGRVLDLYLEVTELAATTRVTHESYIRRIIRPVLGDVKARKIGPDSLDALNVHLKRCSRICGRLGRTEHYADGPRDAYVFSPDPAGAVPWNPDTMTHRYWKYADRVGITSSLKETRHYSATQLLTAGVDLKTVAGRLGHAEASTTLRSTPSSPGPPTSTRRPSFPSNSTGSGRGIGSATSTASTPRR